MAKKTATAAEKRHMERVASLGCAICGTPAQVHHIREGQGIGQRASHFLTIPLCQFHHTGGLGIHSDPRKFRNLYGSELYLLAQTIKKLEI